jgi:hypothetical protein
MPLTYLLKPLVLFVVSTDAAMITGSMITVDGGAAL